MKATKLIAVITFAAFGFCAEGALAQGNEQTESTEQAAPPVTDETVPAGEETESYNETVTIDSSQTAPASTTESGYTDQAERKEKLRVYSGKHDGNNVIADPR
ncbi:MAG: hypothetical protein M3Q95_06030 [Bacteroidota bacterium]|nr:hypothetical protein [Bacteroidota bacterium]